MPDDRREEPVLTKHSSVFNGGQDFADTESMICIRRSGMAAILFIFTVAGGSLNLAAWEQTGVASWYGGIFQGRQTANGETYDTWGYTCAHKTLPFGTILEVVNLNNNLSVKVRVNDRGPFVDERIIDLTYAAARDLDMIRDGTAKVRIVAEPDTMPKVRFNIQVGAWGELENAVIHRRRLADAGLSPVAELGSDGITRIALQNVYDTEVYPLSLKLEQLGYTSLFIYQVTAGPSTTD